MFATISFFSPSMGIKSPSDARGWVSTKLAPDVPPVVFHRDTDSRTPLQGHSMIAIRPSNGGVVIEGVGREAFETVMGVAMKVGPRFRELYPDGLFSFSTGQVALALNERFSELAVHDFVLQNNGARRNLFTAWKARQAAKAPDAVEPEFGDPELNSLAERLFREALDTRCDILGCTVPAEAVFFDFRAQNVRPCKVGTGQPLFAAELRCASNLSFSGPWYVGRLANKACGRIISLPARVGIKRKQSIRQQQEVVA